ncbi:hypothetical protein SAMN05421788_11584 [Filimonas lacunae]|uniref:Uncharacterized protein n=1 Tax=Filimonas lacunae TaxID=477680 RepID=A0A173MBW2_9BACT|nr:hypothetical protein [Filimonas lacunae]BAV05074.1 hypothetical protein FLA_1081 [Filimonas lacunae]SIT34268.1 hypothetical protein SAMN05421788_11584 [Filimonas lacunae]
MKVITASIQTAEAYVKYTDVINPKKEPLTICRLVVFPGLGHYANAELAQIIQPFELLANELLDKSVTSIKGVHFK